jgi:hypothetical protein
MDMEKFNNDEALRILLGKYGSDEERGDAVLKYLKSCRQENFSYDKNKIPDDKLIDLGNLRPQELFL